MVNRNVYCAVLSCFMLCVQSEEVLSKVLYKKHFNDSFDENDVAKYLGIIEVTANFYAINNNEIDINAFFGLFLTNVNLKYSLMNEKLESFPTARNSLKKIVSVIDNLQTFFLQMANNNKNKADNFYKIILDLFSSEGTWLRRIKRLRRVNNAYTYTYHELRNMYSNFRSYRHKVQDFEHGVPSPSMSDNCLLSLALSVRGVDGRCNVDDSCVKILRNGTDFGYALSHRLLLLIFAHYGRGCNILAPKEDGILSAQFCAKCLAEAQYISFNNFQMVDLMFETMCLCAFDGHTTFLRGFWLEKLRQFQTGNGCFGQRKGKHFEILKKSDRPWKLNRSTGQDILDGSCNNHLTALASATYSIAVRYIIETQI